MSGTTDSILAEFDKKRGEYEEFANTLGTLVQKILSASGITVHSVTWRCKSRSSFLDKLERPGKAYKSLDEVTDLAGLRITTYFSDDVDKVAAIIRREFGIDPANSVDKRAAIDPDRFGYQSLHYVVSLTDTRSGLVENARFKGLRIEIQIRSILQHAWAEIEHDIGYKSAAGVPREVRRRFARIAGLLELADAEFVSIREQLAIYEKSVVAEIRKDPASVGVDLVSLRALYSLKSNLRSLDLVVATTMGRPLKEDPASVYENNIDRLTQLGITSVEELEQTAGREKDTVARFADYWMARPPVGDDEPNPDKDKTVPSGIGLFYLLYVLVWRKKDKDVARNYFKTNRIGDGKFSDELAQQLLGFNG